MTYASSVAERAIHSVDRFLNQAMTYAWTSALQRRFPDEEKLQRPQPAAEEAYGGGDICSLESEASTDDDQPLE